MSSCSINSFLMLCDPSVSWSKYITSLIMAFASCFDMIDHPVIGTLFSVHFHTDSFKWGGKIKFFCLWVIVLLLSMNESLAHSSKKVLYLLKCLVLLPHPPCEVRDNVISKERMPSCIHGDHWFTWFTVVSQWWAEISPCVQPPTHLWHAAKQSFYDSDPMKTC